jgi:hypothetical protein
MNLKSHATAGHVCLHMRASAFAPALPPLTHALLSRSWGYSGPLTPAGVPDISGRIHVDGSRPLPDSAQDVRMYRNATVRGYFDALEPRLNAFGYSFRAPFLTGCAMETRRAMACPALALPRTN